MEIHQYMQVKKSNNNFCMLAACNSGKNQIVAETKSVTSYMNNEEFTWDTSVITLDSYKLVNTSDDYSVYEMPFKYSDGRMIYGRYYIPNDKDGNIIRGTDLVIMAHSFGGNYKNLEDYAITTVRDKRLVYIFDFIGGSVDSSSSGDMTQMSLLTEVSDLKLVISKLKWLDTIDPKKIFIIGFSQVGAVASIAAKQMPDDIKGLIRISPAYNIPDNVREKYKSKAEIPETPIMLGERLGKIYCTDIYDMDIWSEIKGYEGPVMIIHGTEDKLVPVSYAKKASEIYDNVAFMEVGGAGHGYFEGESFAQVENAIRKYLKLFDK